MNLTNLNDYTLQEIFDKVSNHLLTQGVKSQDTSTGSCKYKDDFGNKCAVGCLISDEEYDTNFESLTITSCNFDKFNITNDRLKLLRKLQSIHDGHPVNVWESTLKDFAKMNNLIFKNIY